VAVTFGTLPLMHVLYGHFIAQLHGVLGIGS
jgi:hypothetical protein